MSEVNLHGFLEPFITARRLTVLTRHHGDYRGEYGLLASGPLLDDCSSHLPLCALTYRGYVSHVILAQEGSVSPVVTVRT